MMTQLSYNGLTATVDSHGGELVSLLDAQGREAVWNGDPAFWSGRNPLLFPIVGNPKEGTVLFNGKPFHMNRHGFAREQDFSIVRQGGDFVLLRLTENGETLACYPFSFSLTVCHRLLASGFSTSFTVLNTGDTPLPFCIGAHTAFFCPFSGDEAGRFEDYTLVFDQEETADTLLLSSEGLIRPGKRERILNASARLSLDYALFSRLDTVIFEGLHSRCVSLMHEKTGRGIHMDFDGFPLIAFWTKPGAPYLCMEPWHGLAAAENESGEFADKPHCLTLAPQEMKTFCYTVSLLM